LNSSVGFENTHGVRINLLSKSLIQTDSADNNAFDLQLARLVNIFPPHNSSVLSKLKSYSYLSLEMLAIPFVLVVELSKNFFTAYHEHYFSGENYYPFYGLGEYHGLWFYPYDWNITEEQNSTNEDQEIEHY
jgi:hypothetical protein